MSFLEESNNIMKINAFGKVCNINVYLTGGDIKTIDNLLQKKLLSDDYRKLTAKIISNHTHNIFTYEEICNIDDHILLQYIKICVETNDELKEKYSKLNICNHYERFIKSIKLVVDSECAKQLNIIKKSLERNSLKYYWYISEIISKIKIFFKNHIFFSITKEQKQHLIEVYEAWGKLGWTVPPDAYMSTFKKQPKDRVDAYNRLRYCTKNACMNNVFSELRDVKIINKSDLEESIECYNHKYYKASCMILFSIIDSILIKLQSDNDRDRRGFRKSGKGAADIILKRIGKDINFDKSIFTIVQYCSLSEALMAFFEVGGDFKSQPQILNRNFLIHGMLRRKVIRKDCVMIFILLLNLTKLLNSFSTNK